MAAGAISYSDIEQTKDDVATLDAAYWRIGGGTTTFASQIRTATVSEPYAVYESNSRAVTSDRSAVQLCEARCGAQAMFASAMCIRRLSLIW
jgi:hypothetical protein